MPYSTGQQGLPGTYRPVKSEYVKQEQRADTEMKMITTARQSFDEIENNSRIKNEQHHVSGGDVLRKRLHSQYKNNRSSSSDEVIKVKREHQDNDEIFEQSRKSDDEGCKE